MASRGGLSALALSEVALGVVMAWSGIENASLAAALRSLIGGKVPAPDTGADAVEAADPGGTQQLQGAAALAASASAPAADLTGTEAANRALGRVLAAPYGWSAGVNWQALDYGWGHLESGWNNNAQNGTWPGAYGIPQANPGTKMPKAAWPVDQGGSASATSQILWGLAYVKSRYGSPSKVPGWLGQPGYVGY